MAASPGLAMGPGGKPVRTYVLNGWSVARSARVSARRSLPTAYCTVGSAWSGMPSCRRFQKTAEIRRRSSRTTASRSMMEASVSNSWTSSPRARAPSKISRARALDDLGRELRAQPLHGAREHLLGGQPPREVVGVREDVALEARALDPDALEERRIVRRPQELAGRHEVLLLHGPGELGEGG